MPPPPPVTYVDITTTPFTRVVTVAEFTGGTFGGVADQFWFRYVNGSDYTVFGSFTGPATNFIPRTSLFDSTTTVMLQTSIYTGWWVLLEPNETYYIVVTESVANTPGDDFTCDFYTAPTADLDTFTPGDLLINDDSAIATGPLTGQSQPATMYSLTGTLRGFSRAVVAGEIVDALPDGHVIAHDVFGVNGARLQIYDDTLTVIASADTSPSLGDTPYPSICNDGAVFYVTNRSDGKVYTVTTAGVVTHMATIPSFINISATGVKRDGSVLYWTETDPSDSNAIHRHDLNTDTPLSDFYTFTGLTSGQIATTSNGHNGEIIVQSDDSLVTWYQNFTAGNTDEVVHISSAGALLASYTYAGNSTNHLHYSVQGATHITLWQYDSGVSLRGTFSDFNLSTGVPLTTFTVSMFSGGDNKYTGENLAFGPSASCSIVSLGYGDGPPPTTGTVVVVKVVEPSSNLTSFPFTAGGGLSPTSFSLAHGESYTYTDVAPGDGYTVEETVPDGWTVSYSVSNSSLIDNLEVVAGETTTVTVTNGNGTIGFATELPIRWVLKTPMLRKGDEGY